MSTYCLLVPATEQPATTHASDAERAAAPAPSLRPTIQTRAAHLRAMAVEGTLPIDPGLIARIMLTRCSAELGACAIGADRETL